MKQFDYTSYTRYQTPSPGVPGVLTSIHTIWYATRVATEIEETAPHTYPQEKDRMKQVYTQQCVLLLVRYSTSGGLKSKAPTTHHYPPRTAVPQQYNRCAHSTPATHAPTQHAHLPTMYSSTAVFMHSLLLCRI